MYKGIKIGDVHLTAELDSQEPGNYLIGGFIKYYTDEKHPNFKKANVDAPPVKMLKIRVDAFKWLTEVTITNARRRRAR